MRLLLTGGHGFLGKSIYNHFSGNQVFRLGRKQGEIIADLSNHIPKLPEVDLVIHAAGKAHSVPQSLIEQNAFHQVNVTGTENLLAALDHLPTLPKYFVFISSVSVYGLEKGELITEDQALAATDAYGKSKINAERLVTRWCQEHNVICSILRLPLLAGKNPPGNLEAMIKGISRGYYFNISGINARKSMLLCSDVAQFIALIHKLGGIYHLTDGYHPSFEELSSVIARQLNRKKPMKLAYMLVKALAVVGDLAGAKFPVNSKKLHKMTSSLTFSDQKARSFVSWQPKPVLHFFEI